VKKWLSMLGKKGGAARARALSPKRRKAISSKGGKAAQALLTPEQKRAAARHAARVRWAAWRKARREGKA
jgi:hypothetical protein